jgi:hypothetical protein
MKYSFSVEINSSSHITYVSCPNHSKVTKKTGTAHGYIIDKTDRDARELKKDLLVYYKTKDMMQPKLLV